MILETLHILLIVAIAVLIVMALLSPLESLRWFAGWSDEDVQKADPVSAQQAATAPPVTRRGDERYVVWLSGIGSVPGQTQDPFEVAFLSGLRAKVPSAVIVDDAFAYSVRDNPLAGKRMFDGVFRSARASQAKSGPNLLVGSAIQLRNVLQVVVSADGRYGPVYNLGLAEAVGKRLVARGYQVGSGEPIFLIGYSGGGQVSVGAARYLKLWMQAPITVVSIGGVISADPGLESVDHLVHLQGSKDPFPAFGKVVFVGRWPMVKYSYWHQAVGAGKVTTVPTGPMAHMAEPGYFGAANVEKTVSIVADVINGVNSEA